MAILVGFVMPVIFAVEFSSLPRFTLFDKLIYLPTDFQVFNMWSLLCLNSVGILKRN